ncbi:hypothetical protein P9112_003600 [Eukaryota sp. TZLM1-RC]
MKTKELNQINNYQSSINYQVCIQYSLNAVGSASLTLTKIFGGIGSIIAIFSLLPGGGIFFGFAGITLIFIGSIFAGIAIKDNSVFTNFIVAWTLSLCAAALFGIAIYHHMAGFSFENLNPEDLMKIFKAAAGAIVIYFILAMIRAIFFMLSLKTMGDKLGSPSLSTAGTLYLVGFFLKIIVIGFILEFVAYIMMIVGFCSISEHNVNGTQQYVQYVQVVGQQQPVGQPTTMYTAV